MTRIDDAFGAIARADFLPAARRGEAVIDAPVPIGYNQTNSQPSTVRRMLEWLDAGPGDKVLDVGSGSGWTTALLAQIVGPTGTVYAVERVPELIRFGQKNCKKAKITNAQFFRAGMMVGLPEHAPYDRILVSAAAHAIPPELIGQLQTAGKMVIPVNNDILEITKIDDVFDTVRHPGYVFVPLVKRRTS